MGGLVAAAIERLRRSARRRGGGSEQGGRPVLELDVNGVLQVQDLGGGVTVVELLEESLSDCTAEHIKPALLRICKERLKRGKKLFVLDLSAVEDMDSVGAAVLISVTKALAAGDGRMALAGPTPVVQRLLVVTSLDQVFEVHPDVARAAASIT